MDLGKLQSFIFGQGTDTPTYEDVKGKRALQQALMAKLSGNAPTTFGGGVGAVLQGVAARRAGNSASRGEEAGKAEADQQWSALQSLMGGGYTGTMSSMSAPAPRAAPTMTPEDVQPMEPSQPLGFGANVPGIDTFNASLARTESGGDYNVRNSEGYTGKYQFGQPRLDDFNRANGTKYSTDDLRGNEALTEAVQAWHVNDIDQFAASNGLDRFIGQTVGGVPITQNGIRAMAHLGGNGGMQKFLQSGGRYNPADSNGTRLSDYAATHAGGNTGTMSTSNYSGGQQGMNPAAVTQIAQFLDNPYASDGQKALASLMMQRMMTPADPMQALQMEKAQLEIDRMRNPQAQQTDDIAEYEYARQNGFQGSFTDYMSQGSQGGTEYGLTPQFGVDAEGNPVMLQTGKNGTAVQTQMPEGVQLSREPIRIDAGTHWVLLDPITRQPISQIEKNTREAASEQAAGSAEGKNEVDAQAGLSNAMAQAQSTLDLIAGIKSDPALPSLTGMVQGRLPPMSQDATDLNVRVEQLKGRTFLEAFEALKGAGQITEREGAAAQAAMARLDRVQSDEAYIEALTELEGIVSGAMQRAQQRAGVQPRPAPGAASAFPEVASAQTTADLDALISEYPTASDVPAELRTAILKRAAELRGSN